jgi:hypothetical protein
VSNHAAPAAARVDISVLGNANKGVKLKGWGLGRGHGKKDEWVSSKTREERLSMNNYDDPLIFLNMPSHQRSVQSHFLIETALILQQY